MFLKTVHSSSDILLSHWPWCCECWYCPWPKSGGTRMIALSRYPPGSETVSNQEHQAHSVTKTLNVEKIRFINLSVSNCSEYGRHINTLKPPAWSLTWKIMLFLRIICPLEKEPNFNGRHQVLLCTGWMESEERSNNTFWKWDEWQWTLIVPC